MSRMMDSVLKMDMEALGTCTGRGGRGGPSVVLWASELVGRCGRWVGGERRMSMAGWTQGG